LKREIARGDRKNSCRCVNRQSVSTNDARDHALASQAGDFELGLRPRDAPLDRDFFGEIPRVAVNPWPRVLRATTVKIGVAHHHISLLWRQTHLAVAERQCVNIKDVLALIAGLSKRRGRH